MYYRICHERFGWWDKNILYSDSTNIPESLKQFTSIGKIRAWESILMSRSNLYNEKYGKHVLVGVSLLMWIMLAAFFRTYGYEATWRLWSVPTRMPPFLDFRVIPASAESFRMGFEPSIANPRDPNQRLFNYPAFWRIFFYSGITQADTVWISVLMIVLFFLGVFLFPKELTISQAAWMLVVLFSPASMLLYERGNVDLIVFFICAMVIYSSSFSSTVATTLIALGTIVKMFPFFGVSVLLKATKYKFWLLFASCCAFLIGYMLVASSSVNASWNVTPRGFEISYGTNMLFKRYELPLLQLLSQNLPLETAKAILMYGPIAVGVLVVLAVAFRAVANRLDLEAKGERNLAAFRMGASIYVGTFLLGNNWDYRLAFLVLVMPQLWEWMHSSHDKIRSVVQLCMLSLILSCGHFIVWYSPLVNSNVIWVESVFVLDEFLNWILMATLAYLFVLSLPDWMKLQFKSILPKETVVV